MKVFSLDTSQTIRFNTRDSRLDLGAAAAMTFFTRCFDWFRVARLDKTKIRIVIEHDPIVGVTSATFSKRD